MTSFHYILISAPVMLLLVTTILSCSLACCSVFSYLMGKTASHILLFHKTLFNHFWFILDGDSAHDVIFIIVGICITCFHDSVLPHFFRVLIFMFDLSWCKCMSFITVTSTLHGTSVYTSFEFPLKYVHWIRHICGPRRC